MNMKVQDVRLNHVLPSAAAPLCTYCTPPIALCVVEGAVESQHAISDLLLEICTQYIDEKALHSVTPPVIKQFSLKLSDSCSSKVAGFSLHPARSLPLNGRFFLTTGWDTLRR